MDEGKVLLEKLSKEVAEDIVKVRRLRVDIDKVDASLRSRLLGTILNNNRFECLDLVEFAKESLRHAGLLRTVVSYDFNASVVPVDVDNESLCRSALKWYRHLCEGKAGAELDVVLIQHLGGMVAFSRYQQYELITRILKSAKYDYTEELGYLYAALTPAEFYTLNLIETSYVPEYFYYNDSEADDLIEFEGTVSGLTREDFVQVLEQYIALKKENNDSPKDFADVLITMYELLRDGTTF